VPGDLGTKGGLVTDERARVLRPDGTAIEGLYAAGNVSAAVMGNTYAGPGATIGPALVFGYLAAEDIARRGSVSQKGSPETGAEPSEISGGSEAEDGNLRRLGDPTGGRAPEKRTASGAGLDEPEPDTGVTHTAPGAF
jgi:succinate dehydrogenase/fumarate reductase flavoprotein subunit